MKGLRTHLDVYTSCVVVYIREHELMTVVRTYDPASNEVGEHVEKQRLA